MAAFLWKNRLKVLNTKGIVRFFVLKTRKKFVQNDEQVYPAQAGIIRLPLRTGMMYNINI